MCFPWLLWNSLRSALTSEIISDFSKSSTPIIMDEWSARTDYGAAFLRNFISSRNECYRHVCILYITLISAQIDGNVLCRTLLRINNSPTYIHISFS